MLRSRHTLPLAIIAIVIGAAWSVRLLLPVLAWLLPEHEPDEHQQRYALRRAGHPPEIIGAALYLASDASSFTTGATLRVDGGIP